ncbi:YuzL family protein [Ectobacillus panaciterrae]|nr:YuzL family protein [Ectobacillus panaciterrae]
MSRRKKNPSKGAVSAASATGSASHGNQQAEKGRHSTNQQYGKQNMGEK